MLSLLRREPGARPETTEALIDRIDTIAGPPAETVDHAVRGYVRSKAFVGRHSEQRAISQRLRRGQGDAIVVEAAAGLGRSRLLEELSLLGRLSGATSVLVRADPQEPAYGVANRIALGFLNGLPQEAVAAAQTHANVLAQLSPEVQRRLGVAGTVVRDETPGGRSQLQSALTEWLFALPAQKRLLLAVDDIEQSDEESTAWLAALAPYCNANQLLLVVALVDEPGVQPALPLQMFRKAAVGLKLAPLTAAELHELLHSVFGPATYIERVSDSLYRASQGSPAHCLELVEHLVETGVARYSEGTWTLPGHLSDAELPRNRSQMFLARLAQLSAHARNLAELMSIHDGRLTQGDCQALSETSGHEATAALVELTLLGVLIESDQGYTFAHASVREHLAESLRPDRRTGAHARLGASLLAAAKDPIDAMRAGLHLFCAGDTGRCEQLVRAAAMYMFEGHHSRGHSSVPLFEQAVSLYRAAGRGPETLAAPLAALAGASFFVDRRLADRYGIAAIEALEHVLRFDLARKLRRYIGNKLALFVALTTAAVTRTRGGVGVGDALKMLAGAVIALNGVATSSLDIAMTERCKAALEPLSALGERNIVGVVRMCIEAISGLLSENQAAALARLEAMRVLLESATPIRNLNDTVRREFLAGGLLSIGVMECWRQSAATLAIADRIESFGPLYALNADQLRAMYCSGWGDSVRAQQYMQRVETRAIQVGAAWQIVAMGPIGLSMNALWTHDALSAKRAAAELERLSRELPTFRHEARRARATYLVLTGRYRDAIDLMRESDQPAKTGGWSRGQGILARAHNRVGEHARARELCLAALEGMSEEDLSFVIMNLHLQIESVLAEAALGNFASAREQSDRLLARHAGTGPIALGSLHETRARVALLERDFVTCHSHCEAMKRQFASTDIASLHALSERLIQRVAVAESGDAAVVASPATLLGDDAHLMTRMRLILTHTERTFERRAQLGLQIALELTGAHHGFVISRAANGGVVGTGEEVPAPELVSWAAAQLDVGVDSDEQTAVLLPDQTLGDTALLTLGDLRYCVIPLGAVDNGAPAPFALVLGFRALAPRAPSAEVLATLARHLVEPAADAAT
ncbi:MAG TPA: AAA family ATPase [Polyangiales bacterium]|nr:AAA family ATPase [Polyangiales bacterium]